LFSLIDSKVPQFSFLQRVKNTNYMIVSNICTYLVSYSILAIAHWSQTQNHVRAALIGNIMNVFLRAAVNVKSSCRANLREHWSMLLHFQLIYFTNDLTLRINDLKMIKACKFNFKLHFSNSWASSARWQHK